MISFITEEHMGAIPQFPDIAELSGTIAFYGIHKGIPDSRFLRNSSENIILAMQKQLYEKRFLFSI